MSSPLVEGGDDIWFSNKFSNSFDSHPATTVTARRVNLPKSTASRTCRVNERLSFLIGEFNTRIRQSLWPVRRLGV